MITCDSSTITMPKAVPMEHLKNDVSESSNVIVDHFRCPEDFVEIEAHTEPHRDPGYFKFGSSAICYGRSSGAVAETSVDHLHNSLPDVVVGSKRIALTFDPNEIVRNLRMERYPISPLTGYKALLKELYYLIRPLTTQSIRSQIQRFHMAGWQSRTFPRWPVDTTTEEIAEQIMLLAIEAQGGGEIPFIWFWPSGHQGCVLMTHDVETSVGRDFCAELKEIDAAYNMPASFQVVPEGRYSVNSEFLDAVRSPGFELLIQDLNHDGRLFDDRQEFLRRAARIRRYAEQYGTTGFRAAVLYRKPEWYRDLGISFDMSIPNVAHLDPQQGGCCTVFPYFIGDVVELPVTTIQDYSLFCLLKEQSIDLWKEQAELIFTKHGLASFIVHPDYIREAAPRRLYEQLLGWLREEHRERDLWVTLPGEVNRWWRERSQMSLVMRAGEWKIAGSGADRAIVAFASNVEGKLHYRLQEPLDPIQSRKRNAGTVGKETTQ